jgi:hypothetical protein
VRSFANFAVIDWSGQAVARPKGLALAQARDDGAAPDLLRRSGGWSRQAILDWLIGHADAGTDMIVGVDLSPALPFADRGAYFPGWNRSPADARSLWRLVDEVGRDDPFLGASSFVADPAASRHFRQQHGCGDLFEAGRGRLRVCEARQRDAGLSPSSCFNLIGAAQVGKSSLTGMRVLHRLGGRVPVWPFDPVPAEGPVIVEIYTAIAACAAGIRKGLSKIRDAATLDAALAKLGSAAHQPLAGYDDHATDAILTAAWLRLAVRDPGIWHPATMTSHIAATEGWTFGVT